MITIEDIYEHCLSKPGTTDGFPFDENVLAFKVGGKIYGLTNINKSPLLINLKCDPDRAIELRNCYDAVVAGYHMNKKHWNTITVEESDLTDKEIFELIDHSYDLIYSGLAKKIKLEIEKDS